MGVATDAASEQLLLSELEIYRQEVSQCSQFLYVYLAIHALGTDQHIRRGLNEEALFWNTVLGSLQTAIFIALGRVFDANNQHGPAALVRTLRRAQTAFSRDSLKARKAKIFGDDVTGLEDYLAEIAVPGEKEFRRLERLADGYTRQFNSTAYRELRSKVFAHKVYTDTERVTELFSETNIDDLQRMVSFLYRLQASVRDAYDNGRALRLRRGRRSVNDMLANPRGRRVIKPVAEEIAEATRRVLQGIAGGIPLQVQQN